MDTEDELEEENGEILDDEKNRSDDDEEDMEEKELQIGFIVADDHFSVSDIDCSDISD